MDRRRLIQGSLLCSLLGGLAAVCGCGGGESRQTGTVVETPAEDRDSMEASAAAYKAMEKNRGAKR